MNEFLDMSASEGKTDAYLLNKKSIKKINENNKLSGTAKQVFLHASVVGSVLRKRNVFFVQFDK